MNALTVKKLESLLKQAKVAHGKYEKELGKPHADWPKWYAEFIINKLKSPSEFESWKETMEIMGDPDLMKSIEKGEEDIKKGRVQDWEEVKKELKIDLPTKLPRQD